MPNAKVLESKKAVVAALEEQLKGAQAGVLVDYSGITVEQDTELRNACRAAGVTYGVVKNTMVRRALDETGLSALDGVLNGNTSMATGNDDPIAPIKTIADFSKKMGDDKFHIKAAFMEGKVLSQAEIAQLATLTSKKDLYAQLVGVLMAPMANLAAVVNAIAEKQEGGEAAAE